MSTNELQYTTRANKVFSFMDLSFVKMQMKNNLEVKENPLFLLTINNQNSYPGLKDLINRM